MQIKKKQIYIFIFTAVFSLIIFPHKTFALEASFSSAHTVIGQANFTNGSANQGGAVRCNTLRAPTSIKYYEGKLFINEALNNRLLIYNQIPLSNDACADVVVGQSTMSGSTQNKGLGSINAGGFYASNGAYVADGKLFIADLVNNRILIWNEIPTQNGEDADVVVGQADMISGAINRGGSVGANTINTSRYVYSDGVRLFIADGGNNRVLIFNSIPTTNGVDADVVIGQADMTSNLANMGGAVADNTLKGPRGIYVYEGKLFIVDNGNHRVLIYNEIPTQNGASADVVVGQADMLSGSANHGGSVDAGGLNAPQQVLVYQGSLLVSAGNNRILIWHNIPSENGVFADFVIGQPDMVSSLANNGGISEKSLNVPYGMDIFNENLFTTESSNNRALIYKIGPTFTITNDDAPVYTKSFDIPIDISSTNAKEYAVTNSPVIQDADWITYSDAFTYEWKSDSYLTDGPKELYVTLRDNALFNGTSKKLSTLLDFTAPSVEIDYPAYINNTALTLDITAVDNYSDDLSMAICLNEDFVDCPWQEYDSNFGIDVTQGDGNKKVYVKVKDSLDNISEVKSAQITLDRTSPTLSIEIESEYTATKDINISLSGEDSLSGLDKMQICESSEFTGCEWEAYSATKTLTLSTGDGVKTIYAKVKDKAGNISEVAQDTIILDTVNNKPVITQLGLIKNITDKDSLYYHFNANRVRIYGTAESSSTVQFERSNGTKHTTQTDAEGKFLIVIDLPNGETKLAYSSTDLAGNVSGIKIITLNIDPSYGASTEESTQETVTPDEEEVTEEEPNQTEQEDEAVKPVVKSLLVVDSSGNILTSTTIEVEGKKYTTDERGYIHTDTQFSEEMIASIEGRKYTINPANTYLTLTENETENKKFNYLYVFIPALLIVTTLGVIIIRRKSR